jgi:hypothetical protein
MSYDCFPTTCNSSLAPARIVIPDMLLKPIVQWYHERLGHAGSCQLHDTIASLFYHGEQLKATAESTFCHCLICQEVKPPEHVIGQLTPHEAPLAPWDEVQVDCIGPWTIKLPGHQQDLVFDALMCINPVTNIVELIRVESKMAEYIAMTG